MSGDLIVYLELLGNETEKRGLHSIHTTNVEWGLSSVFDILIRSHEEQ